MRRTVTVLAVGSFLGMAFLAAADLAPARSEPNLEKRSRVALAIADQALSEAREAYNKPDLKATEARLKEVREAVELARASLVATGKKPGKSPGPYKYAETKTRELLRRLEGLKEEMDSSDREVIEPVQNKVQEIHDAWLDGILTHAK
jgi:hypothetical protein